MIYKLKLKNKNNSKDIIYVDVPGENAAEVLKKVAVNYPEHEVIGIDVDGKTNIKIYSNGTEYFVDPSTLYKPFLD